MSTINTADRRASTPEQIIATRKADRTGVGQFFSYPNKLGPHRTIIEFKKYSYSGTGEPIPRSSGGRIQLPLPQSLVDSFDINVGSNELGVTGKLVSDIARGARNPSEIGKMLSGIDDSIKKGIKGLVGGAADAAQGNTQSIIDSIGKGMDVATYLARAGLATISPSAEAGLSAAGGKAANPFATLIFSGVNLKNHTLEWVLSPETQKDSEEIRKIIQAIRANILPEYEAVAGGTNVQAIERGLLTYPCMVDITFLGIDEKYYFKLKTSMVSNFTTDFTPNGLAIMKGGKPAEVRLSMTLQEAFIHTAGDYKPIPQNPGAGGTSERTDSESDEAGQRDPNLDAPADVSGTDNTEQDGLGVVDGGGQ